MLRLVLTGILAALFFSSTFVLNRAMSLEGGHWFWTASLRYGWMLVLLCIWLGVTGRAALGLRALQLFCKHWAFWTIAGSVGFGIFYALLSFSASYAPGWVVAATWQLTILATPIVLLLFGRRVSLRAVMFTLIVFAGVLLINIEQATAVPLSTVMLAALPVLGAAFAYPLGNQMDWEARIAAPEQHGPLVRRFIPTIDHPVMEDNICRVLLLTLGSFPLWGVLILWVSPPFPSEGQGKGFSDCRGHLFPLPGNLVAAESVQLVTFFRRNRFDIATLNLFHIHCRHTLHPFMIKMVTQ